MTGESTLSGVKVRWDAWVLVVAIAVSLTASWLVFCMLDLGGGSAASGHDFRLLYSAAKLLRAHGNPYDPMTFEVQAERDGLPRQSLVGRGGQLNQPFVYPPLLAWFVIPLTYLPPYSALAVWRTFSAICVFVGALTHVAAWRTSPPARALGDPLRQLLLALVVTFSPLTAYALWWANPAVLVFGAMGVWTYLLTRDRRWADAVAGCMMTVAVLKPQLAVAPAILAAMLLTIGSNAWVRRRHVALGFVTSATALLASDVTFTGAGLLLAWPGSIVYLSRLIDLQNDMPSLLGLLQATLLHLPLWVWSAVPLLSILTGVTIIVFLYGRLRYVTDALSLLAILTATWCFLTPYAHTNDELMLLCGGLVVTGSLVTNIQRVRKSIRSHRWAMHLQPFSGDILRVYCCSYAVVILWCGGILLYLHMAQTQLSPLAIAPVPILISLALCWQDIRR